MRWLVQVEQCVIGGLLHFRRRSILRLHGEPVASAIEVAITPRVSAPSGVELHEAAIAAQEANRVE
jgi:hypothetical protein